MAFFGWWDGDFLLCIFFRFSNYILHMLFMLTKAAKPTVFLQPSCKALKAWVLAPAMWVAERVPMEVVLTPLMHRASVNNLCSHRTLIDPQKKIKEWTKETACLCPHGHVPGATLAKQWARVWFSSLTSPQSYLGSWLWNRVPQPTLRDSA